MEIKEFQKVFKEILQGKSLRNIEKEYGIDRKYIMKKCKDIFPEGSEELQKFERIVQHNIKSSIMVNVNEQDLVDTMDKLFENQITMEQAYTGLNIDRLTFKERLEEYVINSKDKELTKKYIEYESRMRPDYSHINFKALLIEMVKTNSSQAEIANEYGIPARTIGREIEKLKSDKSYGDLYAVCKEHACRKLQKSEFSIFEKEIVNRLLDKYNEGPIIIKNAKTKEEKEYERIKNIINIANNATGNLKQKAEQAGVSESTLRRMKIWIKNYEKKEELKEEMFEEK